MTDEQQQQKQERTRPKPGRYVGRLIDYGVLETKDGHPQILGVFDFTDSTGEQFQQAWFGSLKPKAKEFTLKALKALGFDELSHQYPDLALGVDGGPLDLNRRVSLTVEDNRNPQTGEVNSRISWVNSIGGALMDRRLDRGKAGDILGRMAGLGGQGGTPDSYARPQGQGDEEVPF